jgi:hypothetical protein
VDLTHLVHDPDERDAHEGDALAGWTPEQQTAHMLELCEAQMESALSEADIAVDSLTRAFASVAESANALRSLAQRQAQGQADSAELQRQIDEITAQMGTAVVAFQFYDKLSQRLGHVRHSLSSLALFVCDRKQAREREQWRRLFATLRRLYRTEEERQIFTMMVEGRSVEEARDHIHQTTLTMRLPIAGGDIELF